MIQTQPISAIPGSAEPMKPVKVRTRSGQGRPDEARLRRPVAAGRTPITSAIRARPEVAETSSAVVAKAAETKPKRPEKLPGPRMPPQPADHGTGNGVLGVLPASSAGAHRATPHAGARLCRSGAPRPAAGAQQNERVKPPRRRWSAPAGSSRSARWKAKAKPSSAIDLARTKASALLGKADPFTEPVVAKDNRTLYRARFAGLERDQAEAVCRTLKRADISCITVRN